ncbi:MAG TPA: PA14 domain-containing protein [Planctomycetota bacterium]|nr:PA14 domain-containing protein [Planctomycetota bacterium]
MTRTRALVLGLALFSAARSGQAYIEALYPLAQFISESTVIAEGSIEKVDPKTQTCFVKILRTLKGRCGYDTIRMTVGGGQEWHPEGVMRHLKVGAPAVLFYNAELRAEIYINRFFCQLYGDPSQPPEKAWWNFTHIEIHCNRTFAGTAEELSRTVSEVLAGKCKPPPPDAKLPAITPVHVRSLAAWGEPPAGALPPSFAKRDPAKSSKPRVPEDPPTAIPGLAYQYFHGQWTELPDFERLQPVSTGTTDRFEVSRRTQDVHLGFRFTGFIEVPRDGAYTFTTVSDDGSKLWIGKTEVVSNDGCHAAVEQSGEILLKKGRHAITVCFFQNEGGLQLDVLWEGPELPRQKIASSALSRSASP